MSDTLVRPDIRHHAGSGVALGLASALAFASSGPVMKPLLDAGWSLGAALLLRMGGAAILLSPWLVGAVRRDPGLLRRHWLLLVGCGLTGVVGCQLFYFSAMQRMPVAVALLVQYLAPVLIVGWVWLRTRRRPSVIVILGSVLAVAGLLLVVDLAGASFDPWGLALALCAAVSLAAYYALAEHATGTIAPLTLIAGGMVVGTAVIAALCLAGVLPFVAPAVSTDVLGASVPWWVSLGWVVLVATTLGYGLGILAVPRVGARLASFVGLTEVLFAMLFAWLLLSQAPTLVQIVGGVLILGGVVLVRADPRTGPRGRTPSVPAVPAP